MVGFSASGITFIVVTLELSRRFFAAIQTCFWATFQGLFVFMKISFISWLQFDKIKVVRSMTFESQSQATFILTFFFKCLLQYFPRLVYQINLFFNWKNPFFISIWYCYALCRAVFYCTRFVAGLSCGLINFFYIKKNQEIFFETGVISLIFNLNNIIKKI